jgi:hypothetical protein
LLSKQYIETEERTAKDRSNQSKEKTLDEAEEDE